MGKTEEEISASLDWINRMSLWLIIFKVLKL
jgi:hypothetical protein